MNASERLHLFHSPFSPAEALPLSPAFSLSSPCLVLILSTHAHQDHTLHPVVPLLPAAQQPHLTTTYLHLQGSLAYCSNTNSHAYLHALSDSRLASLLCSWSLYLCHHFSLSSIHRLPMSGFSSPVSTPQCQCHEYQQTPTFINLSKLVPGLICHQQPLLSTPSTAAATNVGADNDDELKTVLSMVSFTAFRLYVSHMQLLTLCFLPINASLRISHSTESESYRTHLLTSLQ